jgi:hypothetical protein
MNKSLKPGRTKGSPRLEEGTYMGEWMSINGIYLTTHRDFGKAVTGVTEFITSFTQGLNEVHPSQDLLNFMEFKASLSVHQSQPIITVLS